MVDWAKVVTHMITIKGIYGREMYETWYAMSALLRSGLDISPVVTDSFPARRMGGRFRHRGPGPRRQGRSRLDVVVLTNTCCGAPRAAANQHTEEMSMYGTVGTSSGRRCEEIREAGLYKTERELAGPQNAVVTSGGSRVLNFCANNYLGLADHPAVLDAARTALDDWGFGMASVRFICGTQSQHTELERRLSEFLHTEATILYSSCFDANGGIFEVLLDAGDAVISDELNHASIIDGIRLCKATRLRYRNRDMADLRGAAGGVLGRPAAVDRHRRGVLDGRLPRPVGRDLRRWPRSTRRW